MPELAADPGPLIVDLGLQDARAIVTGASKGIGLAVTQALLAEGASVVAGAGAGDEAAGESGAAGPEGAGWVSGWALADTLVRSPQAIATAAPLQFAVFMVIDA